MRVSVPQKGWVRVAIAVILTASVWPLFVYVADLPITERSGYVCPICRASKYVERWLLLPFSSEVNDDNEFTQYFIKHADPKHQHVWLRSGRSRITRTSDTNAHGTPDPLRLRHEAALAILKSLPNRHTRKTFFEKLYIPDYQSPEGQKILNGIWKLNDVYWEDAHRRDWLEQVRKLGLYPKKHIGKHK